MKHLILLGDSLFDNAGYVDAGDSVLDQLNNILPKTSKASLLAIDGDVTNDVHAQLKNIPNDATHAFVSCGGNDALRIVHMLNNPVSSVGDAMTLFTKIKNDFAARYVSMLHAVGKKFDYITVCTVHDSVPNFESRAITALAIFNEVILREAFKLSIPVIDLRIICNEVADYSPISPIEPSKFGAGKIAASIVAVSEEHNFDQTRSIIYT